MSRPGWFERDRRLREEARMLGECSRCGAKAGSPCRGYSHRGKGAGEIRRPHSGRERLADAQAIAAELRQERELHEAIVADGKRRREGRKP